MELSMRATTVFFISIFLFGKGHSLCLQNEFHCADGECAQKVHACDDTVHCRDLSDERESCRPLKRGSCPSGWLQCRFSGECVSADWICDETNDCNDHSDEVPCKELPPSDYTWNDFSILDEARLSLKQINQTFDDFGVFVAKKLRAIGIPKAVLLERLINEVLFLAQLGFVDEDSYFCDKKRKPLF